MPTPSISALASTTLKNRSSEIADNVTLNTALLFLLREKGRIVMLDGGDEIYEPLTYAENSNTGWYSGADILPVAAQELITSAVFPWKMMSSQIVFTGEETLKNAGKSKTIDLVKTKIDATKGSMLNAMHAGIYSDGTGSGGKQLTGLDLVCPVDPTTGTYGGINRADFSFWRPKAYDCAATPTAATITGYMSALYNQLVRGKDQPDLIAFGQTLYGTFEASLEDHKRFTDGKLGQAGFQALKYKNAEVLLENSECGDTDGYFLNTNYVKLKVHKQRNMVPIDGEGNTRAPVNQDAEVVILGWMGNLTSSNTSLLGRFIGA
jgi:hypothetical protein